MLAWEEKEQVIFKHLDDITPSNYFINFWMLMLI